MKGDEQTMGDMLIALDDNEMELLNEFEDGRQCNASDAPSHLINQTTAFWLEYWMNEWPKNFRIIKVLRTNEDLE